MRPAIVITLLLTACGPSGSGRDDAGVAPDADTTPDANVIDGSIADWSAVYGHSGQVLYRLDTTTYETTAIGSFLLGTKSITDIAIDKDDRMLGITLDEVFEINIETAEATKLADLQDDGFTSLSFIPTDLDDPQSAEILVAADDMGRVFEINPSDGTAVQIGDYGMSGAELIRSSGDLFAVHGVGILATVTIGDTLTDADYLARIDPETWNATLLGTGTEWDRIFGVGYWRGKVYGFVDLQGSGGSIVELDPTTGDGTVIDTGAVRWYGAGVTTDAPIVE